MQSFVREHLWVGFSTNVCWSCRFFHQISRPLLGVTLSFSHVFRWGGLGPRWRQLKQWTPLILHRDLTGLPLVTVTMIGRPRQRPRTRETTIFGSSTKLPWRGQSTTLPSFRTCICLPARLRAPSIQGQSPLCLLGWRLSLFPHLLVL